LTYLALNPQGHAADALYCLRRLANDSGGWLLIRAGASGFILQTWSSSTALLNN
jgi:hypothetical protein